MACQQHEKVMILCWCSYITLQSTMNSIISCFITVLFPWVTIFACTDVTYFLHQNKHLILLTLFKTHPVFKISLFWWLAQWYNRLILGLLVLASHMDTGLFPRCSTSYLTAHFWPKKATEDDLSPWATAHTWEIWEEVPVSWLWLGSELQIEPQKRDPLIHIPNDHNSLGCTRQKPDLKLRPGLLCWWQVPNHLTVFCCILGTLT